LSTQTVDSSVRNKRLPDSFRRVAQWYLNASSLVVVLLALLLGLFIGAIVIIVTTSSILKAWGGFFQSWHGPFHALNVTFSQVFDAYRAMFTGSIFDPPALWHAVATGKGWSGSASVLTPLSETLTYATPLVIASIGVGIGFQTGVFNIGANGQAMAGGILGTAAGSMIHVPWFLHLPLTLLAGIVGGALAGLMPGLLKAYTGAHEVIVTIMLNYVIIYLMGYLLLSTALQQPGSFDGVSRTLDTGAQLPTLFGPSSGLRVNYGLLIAAAVVAGAWWFLNRSTLGFDFRVSGANPDAARTAGINSKMVLISVFALSGALAGLAGVTQVAGVSHYIDTNFLVGSAGIGFTAITVALLGQNRPVGIVWGALLFAALDVGGRAMQAQTGIPFDLATVIQAVIVLLVATPALIKQVFHLRSIRSGAVVVATKGWR
jgi:ABC-type uncharacterized transport system permease subunit